MVLLAISFGFSPVKAQEVIRNVSVEKISATQFNILYSLKKMEQNSPAIVRLNIFRRRSGKVEEIFSDTITPKNLDLTLNATYLYQWITESGTVKKGDEIRASIVLSLVKSIVQKAAAPPSNLPPRAIAGAPVEYRLPINTNIELNGSKSFAPQGYITDVSWRIIEGPATLTILSSKTLHPQLVGIYTPGVYKIELTVTDNLGALSSDTAFITIKPSVVWAPKPPAEVIIGPDNNKKQVAKLKGGPDNAFLNLLVPGLGHYFVSGDYKGLNRKKSSFIITAIYGGAVAGAVYFKIKSGQSYQTYTNMANYREYQRDASGNIIGVRGANEASSNQYLTRSRNEQRSFLVLAGVAGSILAGDFIYTFLKGSLNKHRWEKEMVSKVNLTFATDRRMLIAGVRIKL